MKYIDADRLKAEVKRIKNDYNRDSFVSGLAYLGKEEAIDEFCSLIDSLQQEQPEVDFEKEWDEFEDWVESYITSDYPTYYAPKEIARHFYELGLNARKEE